MVSGNYTDDATIKIWDWPSRKVLKELFQHNTELGVSAVAISKDAKYVASGDTKYNLMVFETGL